MVRFPTREREDAFFHSLIFGATGFSQVIFSLSLFPFFWGILDTMITNITMVPDITMGFNTIPMSNFTMDLNRRFDVIFVFFPFGVRLDARRLREDAAVHGGRYTVEGATAGRGPRELDRRRRGHLSRRTVLVDDGHLGCDDVRLHHQKAAVNSVTVHIAVDGCRLGEVGEVLVVISVEALVVHCAAVDPHSGIVRGHDRVVHASASVISVPRQRLGGAEDGAAAHSLESCSTVPFRISDLVLEF